MTDTTNVVLGTTKAFKLDPNQIQIVEGRNARIDYGDIEQLENEILATDCQLIRPLEVELSITKNSSTAFLVDGARRLTAIKNLINKGHNIPFVLATKAPSDLSEAQIQARTMIQNNGKPFTPMEEAEVVRRLVEEQGLSKEEAAKILGKSVSSVTDLLILLKADPDVLNAVKDGTLTKTEGVVIAKKLKDSPDEQKDLIKEVKKSGDKEGIHKLTQGRLNARQWEIAEMVYNQILGLGGWEVVKEKVYSYEDDIDQDVPLLEYSAFTKLQTIALLSGMNNVDEFFEKASRKFSNGMF